MQVLSVASEAYPVVKTGGLADVVGALPAALRAHGVTVRTLLPGYPAVLHALHAAEPLFDDAEFFGGPARVLDGRAGGLDVLVVDAPHLYDRPGNPYTMPDGQDWPDNPQRFAALAFAASQIGLGRVPGYRPDVVHAHDWQAGLAPAYLGLAGGPRAGSVFTVHNLAFQGQVPAHLLGALRLPDSAYTSEGVEYYQSIGMLKAGIRYAGQVTTVSPSYAAEICTPQGGMGLDGLLRTRAAHLTGVLNGIDTAVWDPAADPHLAAPFSAAARVGRVANRTALQARFGLAPSRGALLWGVVSRMSHQKGLDVLLEALEDLLAADGQLVLLGSGEAALQDAFAAAAAAHKGRVGVQLGYDEASAHLIQAGCDALLVPSRFEPCGLTQLCALRYGAVPVVSRVGGLADSVIDANAAALAAGVATGVQFAPVDAAGLRAAIARTQALWRDRRAWAVMQGRGMRTDVGWSSAGRAYAEVYRRAARA